MPPYSWIHLENVWWVLGGGLLFTAAIILARTSSQASFTFRKRSDEELEKERHEFAGAVAEHNRPVPIFIWLVAVGLVIWAVAYTVFSGTTG